MRGVGQALAELFGVLTPGFVGFFVMLRRSIDYMWPGTEPGHQRCEETGRRRGSIMEIKKFDPAEYLDSDEAIAAYMTEALETGDPAFVADALGVVARAA